VPGAFLVVFREVLANFTDFSTAKTDGRLVWFPLLFVALLFFASEERQGDLEIFAKCLRARV